MSADYTNPVAELPRAFGEPAGTGVIRLKPEDFQVSEIPICEPDGEGEHVWLHIQKRNTNTEWVARQLAKLAGVPPRDVSYAGLKDRHAVTEQWFSVQLPGRDAPDWSELNEVNIKVLTSKRHSRKLRRGALRGNVFNLYVRSLQADTDILEEHLNRIKQQGIPNYFAEQRFGHEGGNLLKAEEMFAGKAGRLPRHKRSIYLSAARSYLFNQVLSERVRQNNWGRGLVGDIMQLEGRRAQFLVPELDAELERRIKDLEIHPTGPLYGEGELGTEAEAHALEQSCLQDFEGWRQGLVKMRVKCDRRPLRVAVHALSWAIEKNQLSLNFTLPPGSYATSLLRELLWVCNAQETNA